MQVWSLVHGSSVVVHDIFWQATFRRQVGFKFASASRRVTCFSNSLCMMQAVAGQLAAGLQAHTLNLGRCRGSQAETAAGHF